MQENCTFNTCKTTKLHSIKSSIPVANRIILEINRINFKILLNKTNMKAYFPQEDPLKNDIQNNQATETHLVSKGSKVFIILD